MDEKTPDDKDKVKRLFYDHPRPFKENSSPYLQIKLHHRCLVGSETLLWGK